ncbi:MAG: DUF2971 domain-containing protein [Pseudomonadota bacterium]|jgi:hypothetical protein|nr:DUF2971 domain-containing protein [Pseudomonadota bacterium]MEC8524366.1 DUF2971 domain-containing protein [Pseudomonadota bacterium]
MKNAVEELLNVEDEDKRIDVFHPRPGKTGVSSLYKYFGSIKHISDLFESCNIHHSVPESFNDPFECKAVIDRNDPHTAADIRRHLIKLCREAGNTRKESENLVSQFMKHENFVDVELLHGLNATYGEVKISCFTTDVKNLLMWSHYASSHSGFCVEFSTDYFPFNFAFKVRYTNRYTAVKYPLRGTYDRLRVALEKSDHWSYENQYRTLIVPGLNSVPTDGRVYNFEARAIKAIYLGVNISQESKGEILEMICSNNIKCEVYQAVLQKHEYGLEFIKIY